MKSKLLLIAICLTASASAAVSLQGSFGDLRDSSGAAVSNGTLFILVGFPVGPAFSGGLTANSSLTVVGANAAFTAGQTVSVGSAFGGAGTIFAIGGTGGSTAEVVLPGLNNAGNVASGNSYAIYWFPGALYVSGTSGTIDDQVGGFSSSTGTSAFSLDGMIIPPNGQDVTQGFGTVSSGGNIADSLTNAVNLTVIPEPSAALLGAIGALGLLRRRRI